MATSPSLGNQLYLYQLLARELGCGKQTFLPRVEEVLENDGIDPYDLDAENVTELLGMLDSFVKLTVFKGGRVYATVIRNADWDDLLAKASGDAPADKGKTGGKSWKRAKKGAKPVKPRHKERPQPVVENESPAEPTTADETVAGQPEQAESAASTETATTEQTASAGAAAPGHPASAETAAETGRTAPDTEADAGTATFESAVPAPAHDRAGKLPDGTDEPAPETAHEAAPTEKPAPPAAPEPDMTGAPEHDTTSTQESEAPHAQEPETPARTAPETPSISFTILYDPSKDADKCEQHHAPATEPSRDEPASTASRAAEPKPPTEEPAVASTDATFASSAGHAPAAATPTPAAEPATGAAASVIPATASTEMPAVASATAAAPAAPEPETPDGSTEARSWHEPPEGYPRDLAAEVYCPPALLHELTLLLPFGADVLGIANEYYYIALERGTLEASRSRIAFPLRYAKDGERRTATVRLKRRTGGIGMPWAVEGIENEGFSA